MTPHAAGAPWTYDDYVLLPDDGKRHEILDGEHFVTPAPVPRHQRVLGNLHGYLWTFLREHRLGEALLAPTDVVLSHRDVVQPDLLFVSAERASLIGEKNLPGAPDLAVEILSESSRRLDEVLKKKRYAHFGVGEYWVVDPVLETVKVHRLAGGAYERVAELSAEAGDALTTPLLPGLVVPLREIFG